HTPAGIEGHPRGRCESCGRHLWSEGGYRVPGLKGLFCSLVCIECSIAEKMGQETDCPGADRQRGAAAFLSENSGSRDLLSARARRRGYRLEAVFGVWNFPQRKA